MKFEDYWENYGELHASMCGGDIKQFAKEIWMSANVKTEELKEAASSFGLTVGAIIRRPVDALVNYHLNYILKNQLTNL